MNNRRQIRLKNYDYSENGAYFVTICTYEKRCIFGYVKDGIMHCNDYGKIANEEIENTIKLREKNGVRIKETLNKSHHKIVCTSCSHIFRQPVQKILVMRQHYCGLFVQPDEKSDYAICTNDLISVSLINT